MSAVEELRARYEDTQAMRALRGQLSKTATSHEFNEWMARDVVEYVDALLARVTALEKVLEPFAEQWDECERYNREWPRAPREAYRLAHASLSPKPGDEKP